MASVSTPVATSDTGTNNSRWAALTGILFAAFLIPSVLLTSGAPSTSASAAKVQSWYTAHSSLVSADALVTVLAVIVGLCFFTYLRSCFRRYEGSDWRTTIFYVGAVQFAVSGGIGAGVNATLGDHPKVLSADALQVLNHLENNLSVPMTCAGLALLFLGAGLVIRKTKLVPEWVAYASWVFALAAASVVLGFIALLGAALWVIVMAVYLAVRNPDPTGAQA